MDDHDLEPVNTGQRALLMLIRQAPIGGYPESSRLYTVAGEGEEFRRRAHDALDLALAATDDDVDSILASLVERAERS